MVNGQPLQQLACDGALRQFHQGVGSGLITRYDGRGDNHPPARRLASDAHR